MCHHCDTIIHLAYMVCGETDDLEYLVEVADLDQGGPHITSIAFQH